MNEVEKVGHKEMADAEDRAFDCGTNGTQAVEQGRYKAALWCFNAAIESVQFLIQQEGE